MSRVWILGLAAFVLVGCGPPSDIGQNETDKAYPKQSQSQMEADLKKEGKYDEYKAAMDRNAAVEAQNRQINGGQDPGQR